MDQQDDRKWLSAQQVANRYGLTRNWVYHCEELRKIAKRFGKYLRYPLDGVIEYEKTRTHDRKHGPGSTGYDLPALARNKKQELKKKLKFDIM